MKLWSAFSVLGLSLFCAIAHAEPPAPSIPASGHALTAEDLDIFLDGFMPLALERGDIAGAVVVVVKDGRVLFEKGYGVSDTDKQSAVDPRKTLFRPGSISKLFTWTAVMQLVEQHKLNLDADINTYLDFQIPPAFGKPITLRNLMTHTPGFEDTIKDLFTSDPKKFVALGPALKTWVPQRVFAPGEVPAYSNYGAALAGYIVQLRSGERFETYVARHILQPLAMTHSTFVQPLPDMLARDMSKGYDEASEKPHPFELVPMSPAGGLTASADDMARFMLAHLGNGSYSGARILKPETAMMMHGVALQRVPGIPGMAYGFYHEDRNGHVIIGHAGDTLWFHSDLHLILDSGVGLFVSQNSAGKDNSGIRGPFFKAFMDRYFPAAPLPAEPTLKTAAADGALAAGNYVMSRNSFSNILSIGALLDQPKVSVNDDGTISVDFLRDFAGAPKKFREIRPFVWREVHGRQLLIGKTKGGRVTEIATDAYPQVLALLRAPWWQSKKFNLPVFVFMFGMLTLTALFWPIKAMLRWRYNVPFVLSGRSAALYRMTRIVSLCYVIMFGGLLAWFTYAADNRLYLLSNRYDWMLRIFQVIGAFGTVCAIAPVLNAIEAFHDHTRPWWTKCSDILVATACMLGVWYAISQHALTTSLNY